MGRNFLGCPWRAHDEVDVSHEFVIEHQCVPASEGKGGRCGEAAQCPHLPPRNPQPARWRGRSSLVARPLPLAQRGVEGLPVGALQVVVVEVLELWRRGRLGALLELQRVLLAVGSGGGGVAVGDVGVGAGRVKFCSHLPLQGQGHYLIASWHLAVWPRALFGLL